MLFRSGMVVPRKKAASADNAIRIQHSEVLSNCPENEMRNAYSTEDVSMAMPTAQSVWEQRSVQLQQAKHTGPSRRSNKKPAPPLQAEITSEGEMSMGSPEISRVQYDVQLNGAEFYHQSQAHPQMKLIGPIPKQYPTGAAPSNTYHSTSTGVVQRQPPSGPVQMMPPPSGYIQNLQHGSSYMSAGPIHSPYKGSLSGPVFHPHHPPQGHHSEFNSSYQQQYQINEPQYKSLNSRFEVSDDAPYKDSYKQFYLQNRYQPNFPHELEQAPTAARWNDQQVW